MLNSTHTHKNTPLHVKSFLLTSSESSSFGEVSGLDTRNELTFVVRGVPAHESRLPLSTLWETQRSASEGKLTVRSIVGDRNTPKNLNTSTSLKITITMHTRFYRVLI